VCRSPVPGPIRNRIRGAAVPAAPADREGSDLMSHIHLTLEDSHTHKPLGPDRLYMLEQRIKFVLRNFPDVALVRITTV